VSRLPAARLDEALRAWQFYTGWWGGHAPLRCAHWNEADLVWRQWPKDHAAVARHLDEHEDVEIRLGLPWTTIGGGGVSQASVLWAVIEGAKQVDYAKRFRPLPTFAIAEGAGSRRTLFWALDRPAGYFEVVEANKRLAYRFGAVQKWADPDLLWVPAPGTCLREDRARPAAVRMSRLTTSVYSLTNVTRGLKAPPENKYWERKTS
jgi:hypothetical protein